MASANREPQDDKKEDKRSSDRSKSLDTALAQIERQFGKGAVMKMGDRKAVAMEVIPTGSVALDIALGVGGLPRGRVVEIYGPESSGKTTVALHAIANAQKAGGIAAFIDAEHALDPEYAKKLGVDIDALLVSQPDTGEQALETVSYTHLRAHETGRNLVCRLLLEKKQFKEWTSTVSYTHLTLPTT